MADGFGKVLVTGGIGFIGRHLADALLGEGADVSILDNAEGREPSPGARLLRGDVRNQDDVDRAVAGAELVFHVAGNASGTISVLDPRLDFDTNAVGSFNVADAAARAEVGRLVYISSASVYGTPVRFPMDEEHPTKPFVPYGASKLSGELASLSLFHATGLPVVSARPFCVYGPGEDRRHSLVEPGRYLRWHLNRRPIQIVGDPDRKTRDFVHVSDLVASLLLLARAGVPGEIYNAGSGEEVSMRQLVEAIGEATHREPQVETIPEIAEDTYRLVADISKLKALGYEPKMPLRVGLAELAGELGENPEIPTHQTIFRRGQRAERS
ncbi:MAG TPA: NAD-dependent epimerase/dehydratase family protein [Gaiellaceae bacterium]|nr:NAD-dependent epimerase/dehydratase family protein [Gaiellaceae bacterium]